MNEGDGGWAQEVCDIDQDAEGAQRATKTQRGGCAQEVVKAVTPRIFMHPTSFEFPAGCIVLTTLPTFIASCCSASTQETDRSAEGVVLWELIALSSPEKQVGK